jgi:hypothetical protein
VTVWRGEAHRIGVGEVETVANKAIPDIPAQAALFCDCPEGSRFMGYVTGIVPAKMERWLLRLDAAGATVAAQEAAVVDATPAAFPATGTPISALRSLSTARTWAAIKDTAQTVEEIAVMSDEALLSLSGVGTKSLDEIRRAVDKVLPPSAAAVAVLREVTGGGL